LCDSLPFSLTAGKHRDIEDASMELHRVSEPSVQPAGDMLRATFNLSAESDAAWRAAFRGAGMFSVFAIPEASFDGPAVSVNLPRKEDLLELVKTVDRCISQANQKTTPP